MRIQNQKTILGLVFFLFLFSVSSAFAVSNSSFSTEDNSTISVLSYERVNQITPTSLRNYSTGTDAYFSGGYDVGNIYVSFCNAQMSTADSFGIGYASESRNITASIIPLNSRILSVNPNTISGSPVNCTRAFAPLSASFAVYPGYVHPIIYHQNGSRVVLNSSLFFNGSYEPFILAQGVPKYFTIRTDDIRDEFGDIITRNQFGLVKSIITDSNVSLFETVASAQTTVVYNGTLTSTDNLIINGISIYDFEEASPCFNATLSNTYYLLNESSFSTSDTCIIIDNISNSVFNFANEIIDGDNELNGSLREGICPILVKNSQNITVIDLRTQHFSTGICIEGSQNVKVVGTIATENINHARVSNQSTAHFENISFTNISSKVIITENSTATFEHVLFATANIFGTFYNTQLNAIYDPATLPVLTNFRNISQHIEVRQTQVGGWAKIGFIYETPLPNRVIEQSLRIFKFNGGYGTQQVFNPTTRTMDSISGWSGTWSSLVSTLDMDSKRVITDTITTFSIFTPMGQFVGSSGSSGSSFEPTPPQAPPPEPVVEEQISSPDVPALTTPDLDLLIPKNLTLMQGEVKLIEYTAKNLAPYPYYAGVVTGRVDQGWKIGKKNYDPLAPQTSYDGELEIGAYEKALPGIYEVPITLTAKRSQNSDQLYRVTRILEVTVIPRGNLSRIKVYEYEPVVRIPPRSEMEMFFLTKNIGDVNLQNVQIKYVQNQCTKNIVGDYPLKINELRNLSYYLLSAKQGVCEYSLRFMEGDTLLEFIPITVVVSYTVYAERLGLNIWWLFAIGGAIFGLFFVRLLKKKRE